MSRKREASLLKKPPACGSGLRHHYGGYCPPQSGFREWELRCKRGFPKRTDAHPYGVVGCRVVQVFRREEGTLRWQPIGYRELPTGKNANEGVI